MSCCAVPAFALASFASPIWTLCELSSRFSPLIISFEAIVVALEWGLCCPEWLHSCPCNPLRPRCCPIFVPACFKHSSLLLLLVDLCGRRALREALLFLTSPRGARDEAFSSTQFRAWWRLSFVPRREREERPSVLAEARSTRGRHSRRRRCALDILISPIHNI